MPLPFLILGAIGAAGVFGAGKAVKAGIDTHDAKETNSLARSIIDEAKEESEKARENCMNGINSLGEAKIYVLDTGIKPFIDIFDQLHNIELTQSFGMNEAEKLHMNAKDFDELKDMQGMASSIAQGLAGGAVAGAVTAFGAFGAAGALGVASTGTAIASLTGAAATNATLAFLGGGTLAAGGLGVAGGTAILGGLVAAPALAILGIVAGAKASAKKDEAYSNLAKAEEFEEEMKTANAMCRGIRLRANLFERLILKLNCLFEPMVYSLEQIIANKGADYSAFNEEEQKIAGSAIALAGAIKAVLDTPILSEDGQLTEESAQIEDKVNNIISDANE